MQIRIFIPFQTEYISQVSLCWSSHLKPRRSIYLENCKSTKAVYLTPLNNSSWSVLAGSLYKNIKVHFILLSHKILNEEYYHIFWTNYRLQTSVLCLNNLNTSVHLKLKAMKLDFIISYTLEWKVDYFLVFGISKNSAKTY